MYTIGVLTTGQAADRVGVPRWCVQRLMETGRFPVKARFGTYRLVDENDLPALRDALLAAGYLKPQPEAVGV